MILQEILEDKDKSKGFTAIELILVVAISLIVLSASIPIYGNLQGTSQLNDTTSGLVQTIRTAKDRSVNRLNNSSHGIYLNINPIGTDSYVLYQGNSYATRDSVYDREIELGEAVSLSSTLTSNEVSFSRGLGLPSEIGTITVTHSVNGSKLIDINTQGLIDLN